MLLPPSLFYFAKCLGTPERALLQVLREAVIPDGLLSPGLRVRLFGLP